MDDTAEQIMPVVFAILATIGGVLSVWDEAAGMGIIILGIPVFAAIWIAYEWDRVRQGWHDKAAATLVVKT